jgi:hypothetical protein
MGAVSFTSVSKNSDIS